MYVVVVKNDKESNERLVTRFNKKVQSSRKILKVRSERYHKKEPTKIKVRKGAVKREYYRAKKQRNQYY